MTKAMMLYWVLGLIVAVAALGFAVLRIRGVTRSLEKEVDIPLWDADHDRETDWPEAAAQHDETAPAILSRPEWKVPRSG